MSNPVHSLAQQLTGKPTLEECNSSELKNIVQRYPFFASAQFLLLQKLRESNLTDEAATQYKKAVLYYSDPLAFELSDLNGYSYLNEEVAPSILERTDSEEENAFPNFEPLHEYESAGQSVIKSDEPIPQQPLDEPASVANNNTVETADLQPEEKTSVTETALQDNVFVSPANDSENISSDAEQVSVLSETLEPVVSEQPLVFEPFHTVDYFASQGIKISADEIPEDKLGKQLKSFTEWLRTMKRLPPLQAADTTEKLAEIGVENMASRSVSDSEVLTEAMAEVWAKQGVPEKALDIYNKLSLHNPSKRDYFAAKIDNLKQS